MSAEQAEMFDDAPSPWWPCPEFGGIEFRTLVLFERGQWSEYDEGEYIEADPPEGFPGAVYTDDVECFRCGFRFDIHGHYKWPGSEDES